MSVASSTQFPLGLLRLPTFYQRVHPPTMGTTLGTALVLAGSMLTFTAMHEIPVKLALRCFVRPSPQRRR